MSAPKKKPKDPADPPMPETADLTMETPNPDPPAPAPDVKHRVVAP